MKQTLSLSFLGAAGTVTGSRYLLELRNGGQLNRILVDCGLFQGYKNLRQRNWRPFPVEPETIDAVLLTHAHLDHSGYLPLFVRNGFEGPIYCTAATRDLCEILLLDAAHLQEEEAAFRNRHHYSKHEPALPLYNRQDAERALKQFKVVEFDKPLDGGPWKVRFHPNGHILGSAFLDVEIGGRHILFTGDLGRPNDLIMRPPEPPVYCDYLVTESTYGNRLHDNRDLQSTVADIINTTVQRGGSVLIPSFAVGRAQAMLYLLNQLRQNNRIPNIPMYLDSPMAIRATEVLQRHCNLHRLNKHECQSLDDQVTFTRTVDESRELDHLKVPSIILSASGMATGGRVLHHLKRMIRDHRNTVLFAGFQAGGTRGARLVDGAKTVRIFGKEMNVQAEIQQLAFLSAHADYQELTHWLQKIPVAPKQCFITHGEPEASDQLRLRLNEMFGWSACVPEMGERVEL
ncbi:MBL fold metallo-hydrolase [Porticoccaceae bacterium LTM1]|nr:MBL fold metallo-hydrolase [Porticoccaceae bacterium LTM1]